MSHLTQRRSACSPARTCPTVACRSACAWAAAALRSAACCPRSCCSSACTCCSYVGHAHAAQMPLPAPPVRLPSLAILPVTATVAAPGRLPSDMTGGSCPCLLLLVRCVLFLSICLQSLGASAASGSRCAALPGVAIFCTSFLWPSIPKQAAAVSLICCLMCHICTCRTAASTALQGAPGLTCLPVLSSDAPPWSMHTISGQQPPPASDLTSGTL